MSTLPPHIRIITLLRSLLFALLFYGIVTVPLMSLTLIARYLGQRPIAAIAQAWAWSHRVLAHIVLGQKVVVEGALPAEAHFIVSKHESMFETIDALCLFHRPAIAAKRELLEMPVWGPAAQVYGLIPVDRKAGASALRRVRAAALAALSRGRTVIFYPEGTRVAHGEAPPLRAGFAGLYTVLGVPVVPIALDSGRLSPRKGFLKRAGTITYRIGEPIPPGLPRAEAEARVHAAINALNPVTAGPTADSV